MQSARWVPVLEGEESAKAIRTAGEIAEALRSPAVHPSLDPSVSDGHAAAAILHACLARSRPGCGYDASAAADLHEAMAAIGSLDLPPGIHGGFTGIGWAVEHLRDEVPGIDGETCAGIDEGVLAWLEGDPWLDTYDLISGLVGLGVYALERLPHPGGVACLERVIDRLAETAEEQADGITWRTRPALLIPRARSLTPEGRYDLGLAHGIPGVIALLGEAWATGVASARVGPLLDGAVRWLLRRRQPPSAGSAFPYFLTPGLADAPQRSRTAWCYGDPGVAVALLGAARRVGEPRWEAAALEVARQAARRPVDEVEIVEANLCHGSAGLGHLFNRFFQATGDPLFRDAAGFWLRRTLALREPGQGLLGYRSWGPRPGDPKAEWTWVEDPGFLTGATGIALALLAAAVPIEPRWDRLLLTRI